MAKPGSGDWHLRVLWIACTLLPREIREEQFSEWRDELQCAREQGLMAGRRTLSIVRSVPLLAWRARRSAPRRPGVLRASGGLGRRLSSWGRERSPARLLFWFVRTAVPLALLSVGFPILTFDFSFNDAVVHLSNEELAHPSSPTWLFYLSKWAVLGSLASLIIAFWPSGKGPAATGALQLRLGVVISLTLVIAFGVRMVVFDQHVGLLYLTTGVSALFLIAFAIGRNQRRRLLAAQS